MCSQSEASSAKKTTDLGSDWRSRTSVRADDFLRNGIDSGIRTILTLPVGVIGLGGYRAGVEAMRPSEAS
ncbi:uncharacterized protein METZ01_LOCUS80328, partial [marine metagenome]